MDLTSYSAEAFQRGRSRIVEAAWLLAQALFVNSWIPGTRHRVLLLRLFGASIGKGVTIKPYLRVKFPWRLAIGDHTWLGESLWIENLTEVRIGNHCCISQGAFLCTGSHDWSAAGFDLITRPIHVGDKAWICANAGLGPGTEMGEGAILTIGSVAVGKLDPWLIYSGHPAAQLRRRKILQKSSNDRSET